MTVAPGSGANSKKGGGHGGGEGREKGERKVVGSP
jgi:hypothetical protein